MHLLFAEDDERLAALVVHMLKKEQYAVDWVSDGDEALLYAQACEYDLYILDWMMPKQSGIAVCKELRRRKHIQPILMLTAKDALDDRVDGLDAGADDYLVKPFEFLELFARIRALSRRRSVPLQQAVIQAGALSLDLMTKEVKKKSSTIQLTPKEFQLLELFMQHQNQVLPRETIIDRVWGFDAIVTNNALDALVRLLRKKIEFGQERYIQNVRGIGYRLVAENVSKNS